MSFTKLFVLDRASGLLSAQLLSSQTSGTFTFEVSPANPLGTQSWNMPSGYKAVITIENEQILLSALSIAGTTVTGTIETRGYNSTQAATHASNSTVAIHLTKAHVDAIENHIAQFVETGLIVPASVTATPTITNASTHSVAGIDVTGVFTVGRAYLFKVSGVWYRAVIRSSSFSTNTTINLSGDGLPAAGTIQDWGVEFEGSVNAAIDYKLIKEVTNVPAQNPPSGYNWLFTKSGKWYTKDSSGNIRFLNEVRSTASSSGGTLTLDWSVASVYDVTLTENITGVTHQNGVDGENYTLRLKQHASSAKTVALGTGGGTRFSDSISSYAMTAALSAVDILNFRYNLGDTKYDLIGGILGLQTSPAGSSATASVEYGDGTDGAVDMDGTNTYAGFASKSGNTYTLTRDVYATTFQVQAVATLNCAGYRVFCTTSFTNQGTTHNKGGDGAAGSESVVVGGWGGSAGGAGGTAGGTGSMIGGAAGGAGGGTTTLDTNGTAGTAGSTMSSRYLVGTGAGAAGGAGQTTGARSGGAAGAAGASSGTAAVGLPRNSIQAFNLFDPNGTAIARIGTSSGSGGGGSAGCPNTGLGATIGAGGGGGGSGGILFIFAPSIVNSGTLSAAGGAGGRGGNHIWNGGTINGTGGGGGGNGGIIILGYKSLTNTGTITVAAGTGGVGGINNGSGGGTQGSSGGNGTAGTIYKISTNP